MYRVLYIVSDLHSKFDKKNMGLTLVSQTEMQPPTKSSFILENEMYSSTVIFVSNCNANEKGGKIREKKVK